MRVVARLHAAPPRHNAGAEWMAWSMFRALVERGHEVSVWLSRYGEDHEPYELDGVQVIPLESRLDFATAVRQASVLVSHLENVKPTAALARGYGKPFVAICHNTFTPTFKDMASGGTALAVYNSMWMEREAELYFADYPKSIRPAASMIVRPPVFAEDYATKPGDLITLVNTNPDKGGGLFHDLAERMPDRRFLAVMGSYGQQTDYSDLANVEVLEQVSGHEMREKVYARTRVLLMPSFYESWGRAGVEAMTSGIPVLAHPTPGLCESLAEGGVFLERQDLDGWEAVLRKLETPAEYRLASKRAKARSAELDPTAELASWCAAVEALV
ncbi:glycosyltransferase family 4 protein [Streptomyces sp. ID05-04B]|uniref:glycosyltransferase family 4 protein n=1 Tax=Streptomyces sp. ID05-04B TaxID=3028661 RepID=UPI0029C33179|nr:glycosyltransferase family 4 protein [Streptomyces sp. ID05-04B]MDX5563764.1 glycosyltransferase family 4 protein [Streptomyces sp. ID05-04B]